MEWEILAEVAEYYAAAESLRRRIVAIHFGCEDGGPNSLHAAATYGADIDPKPEKPYRDTWSLYKAFKHDWLKSMWKEFGIDGMLYDDDEPNG